MLSGRSSRKAQESASSSVRRRFSSSMPLKMKPSSSGASGKPPSRNAKPASAKASMRWMSNELSEVRYTPSSEKAITSGTNTVRRK